MWGGGGDACGRLHECLTKAVAMQITPAALAYLRLAILAEGRVPEKAPEDDVETPVKHGTGRRGYAWKRRSSIPATDNEQTPPPKTRNLHSFFSSCPTASAEAKADDAKEDDAKEDDAQDEEATEDDAQDEEAEVKEDDAQDDGGTPVEEAEAKEDDAQGEGDTPVAASAAAQGMSACDSCVSGSSGNECM